jgi:predicted class III extradiol MEMO1 family dioxygenase
MLAKMRTDFDSSPVLPPGTTAAIAEALATQEFEGMPAATTEEERASFGAQRLSRLFDQWIAEALKEVSNPSLDALPKAVVAPHLDYPRGWINYGHTYGRLRVTDRPDRVIVLGTNHFGEGTGVVGCDKGFQTPLGTCEVDQALVDALRKQMGTEQATTLFANRYDHEREHSIELQIPWIQHIFGKGADGAYPKVFAALVHDPAANGGESYDGNGVALDPFVDAMKHAIAALPGRTLVVCSADLSHVGPSFGDQVLMAGDSEETVEFRNGVFRHDREMLGMLEQGKPDEMIASMSWQQNPTRWCSLGNLVAGMRISGASKLTIFSYAGAMDPQGQALVSSVSGMME